MINIFILVVLMAAMASIFLMAYTFIRHRSDKSLFLIFLSVASFLYVFGYLLEICSQSLEAAFYAVRVQYMGWPLIMPMAYLFIRDVYGEKRFSLIRVSELIALPMLVMAAVQFFPMVQLYYVKIEYVSNGHISNCRIYPGSLYYLWIVYGYLLSALVVKYLIRRIQQSGGRQRRQGLILLPAVLVPVLASLAYVFFYHWIRFDPTPISISISLALMIYAVGRDGLLNMLSLARAQVIEDMQDALVICDYEYNFLDANRAAKTLFPELETFMPGMGMERISTFKSDGDLWLDVEGNHRFFSISRTHIQEGTKKSGICVAFHDITEREQLLNKLQIQANFDPLLHIYNRAAFFEMALLALSKADAQDTSYALLMMDIDHFKRVNDLYGHLCGDVVLETIALTTKECLRKNDLIGRYGGEEIVILLADLTADQMIRTANELCGTIEKTACIYNNESLYVTVSIGITHAPAGEIHNLEHMIAQADAALYRAKNSGRNRVCI